MLITGLAWGIASTRSAAGIIRLALLYISVHFLAFSLVTATMAFFLVGRLLKPGIMGLPGRRRQQGLFTSLEDSEQLEFGYCFDVSWGEITAVKRQEKKLMFFVDQVAIRAFFPVWFLLYVVQFLLWPLISKPYWYVPTTPCKAAIDSNQARKTLHRLSLFFGNTLYLAALTYYTVIIFLGYNGKSTSITPVLRKFQLLTYQSFQFPALPFLHHTELLLSPIFAYATLWLISLFGFNIPQHIIPLLVLGAR